MNIKFWAQLPQGKTAAEIILLKPRKRMKKICLWQLMGHCLFVILLIGNFVFREYKEQVGSETQWDVNIIHASEEGT